MESGKMSIRLNYGREHVECALPSSVSWERLAKKSRGKPAPFSELLESAIDDLHAQLGRYGAARGCRMLLVIPDHTRRCRLDLILPRLTSMLERDFAARITLLVANGSHRLVADESLTTLVGEAVRLRYPISQHDCLDRDSLLFFGETSCGTPVWLNRRLRESDWVITICPIVLHYFAGFGGGPKMIFPGLAGYDTIAGNHRRAIDFLTGRLDERAREGNIEDNPVYRDLAEVEQWIPNWISWQMVLDEWDDIRDLAVGPPIEVHRKLAAKAFSFLRIPIGKPGDVVLASAGGYPSDVNLIQAHKSIHHAFQAVRENGWLIILAECSEGIGSETFLSYFDCGSSEAIVERLRRDYRLNGQTALALRLKTEKARIVLVSRLAPALVRKTGMIPAADFEEAWSQVSAGLSAGKRARGYVFPNAAQFLPLVSSS